MGKWRDFFRTLATNYDVIDDKYIETELKQFEAENAASVKRVAELENRLHVDLPKKTKPLVNRMQTPTKTVSKVKTEKEQEKERE